MISSRERIAQALEHKEPERIPIDIGGSGLTGMHVSTVYRLRQKLELDPPDTPVKVIEPYQMLGEIKRDLADILGSDTIEVTGRKTMFGFKNEGWKEWKTFDGTPVLVPSGFNTVPDARGDIPMYPEGDTRVPPSGRMPKDGWYFDAIIRQEPFDENDLRLEDNIEEFGYIGIEELEYLGRLAESLYTSTDKSLMGSFGGTSFGDIATVPAPFLKHPKGIRDIEEWYISTTARRDFVYNIFEYQCNVALVNLQKVFDSVGNRIAVAVISGTDFGTQNGPFISPKVYRDLFKPFHRVVNDWIHTNTEWKTFIHSCGSVAAFIDDFIDAGFDILNPVQCSAAHMDARALKERFGDRITFWGGGVDTQHTLPFGTPEDVRKEVGQRMEIFGKGGGFVFATIHNIQARTPVENIIAMFDVLRG
jgi:hypothetical protein